ncbi:MAG TPA: hypothetical protein V6D47_10715 [Oscillatoriaceae cyanobacterium]
MFRPVAALTLAVSACLLSPIAALAAGSPASPTATLSPQKQQQLKQTLGQIRQTTNSVMQQMPKGVVATVQSRIDWSKLTPAQKTFYVDALGDGLVSAAQVNNALGVMDDKNGMTEAGEQFTAYWIWVRTHDHDIVAALDKAVAKSPRTATNAESLVFITYLTAHPDFARALIKQQFARIDAMERAAKAHASAGKPAPSPAASK